MTNPLPREPIDAGDLLAPGAPLLASWLRATRLPGLPFTVPGHKRRTDLVGEVVRGDIPLYGGLDGMQVAQGNQQASEDLAAQLWGAGLARWSVGGSTHGNQAMCLTVARPDRASGSGGKVIVGRSLHRSTMLGIVLAGLEPVWVLPDVDQLTGLTVGVSPRTVAAALAENPDAVAVMLVEPSYIGTLTDVSEHARIAHSYGIPLCIDMAWAAHFGFGTAVPPHAIAVGADIVVTSMHKTLPSVSQAALVMVSKDGLASGRVNPHRFARAMEATATTSPAGQIMASADAARALFAIRGPQLVDALVALVATARAELAAELPGAVVLGAPGSAIPPAQVDPAKLVLSLPGTGADGIAVDEDLVAQGFPLEMADHDTLSAIVTVADRPEHLRPFVSALVDSVRRHSGPARPVAGSGSWTVRPQVAVSPRAAFFAEHETVPAERAAGRISAELIAPYPPGVPVLAPGEIIAGEAISVLQKAKRLGTKIAYAADPTLATFQVVRN